MRGALACLWIAILATPAQARPTERDRLPIWPAPLSASLSGGVVAADLSDVGFRDLHFPLQRSGEELALGRVLLVGTEASLSLASDVVRFAVGVGFYGARPGPTDGRPSSEPRLRATRLRLTQWFGELGIGHRFGDFTPFLTVRAAAVRILVESADPEPAFRSLRLRVGPRLGFRAHLWRRLFVEAAASVALHRRPDPLLTLGLGIGER